ncbi:MAG: hypothetical protein U9N76_05275 [Candidatus Marinimicrobia bacterium]|nr:hypothetical protein [Candidatus Neomarinimicrobiota bacterium]
MRKVIISLLFIITIAFSQIQINTDIKPKKGYIGNSFRYEIEIIFESKYDIEIPKFADARIANFEILSKDISTERNDKTQFVDKLSFELTIYDTGWQEIPPVQIGYKDTLNKLDMEYKFSDAENIYIFSAMDSIKNVADVKPPFSLKIFTIWNWILIVILILVIGYLIWYGIIKKREKTIEKEEKYQFTIMEIANEKLEELRNKNYLEKGMWKEFYIELTFIVKEFYEEYYFIHLKESITEEILPILKTAIPKKEYDFFNKLFTSSDFVKFAKQESTRARCENDFKRVEEIIKLYE